MSGCQQCDGYCFQPEVCGDHGEPAWAPELRQVLGEALSPTSGSPIGRPTGELAAKSVPQDRVEEIANVIASWAFGECQPDKGNIFGWLDDHKESLAQSIASLYAEEIGRQQRVGDLIVSRRDLADMMDAKDAAEAANERLKAALDQAVEWFLDYERQHRAKCTTDGDAKAATNLERANFLFQALTGGLTS